MIVITDIRPYRRTKLFEVYSETGMEFLANEKFLNENEIFLHAEFDEYSFEQLRAKAQVLDGIRKCVDFLSRKDYSKKELLKKLRDKEIPEDAAEIAVSYMEQHGYQSDIRYARRLAELAKASYGKKRAEQILQHHGIDREIIREVTDEVYSDIDAESEKLDNLLQKAVRGKDLRSPADKNKIYAKLTRLGYTSSAISATISRYRAEGKDENF